jgi:exonuclease SbcC
MAAQIEGNEERKGIRVKIEDIQVEILALQSVAPDNLEFKTRRQVLVTDLDALKKQRDIKEQIKRGQARVAELQNEEQDYSNQLVEVEGIEYIIQEFIRARISTLEERINGKFQYARFKLFDTQVNGQEVECCETTYKGVVFGTLNTAAKILVGIDIINTLSAHYGVSAPIFLDNRESVTSIPDTDAQIINLIVSPSDKQLRVA